MKKETVGLCVLLAAFLFAVPLALGQTSFAGEASLPIPQILDGGPWQTTIALTNTSANQAFVSLSFFQETAAGNTSSWPLNFVEMTSAETQNLMVPGGSTLFLHTPGTATTTTVGWGQLLEGDASVPVVAYAIFTQHIGASLQSGTAPAALTASRILVPFDNTNGAVTTMAIANTTSSGETINVGIRTASATTQPAAITLPANGHASFTFAAQFTASAGQSGLAEFYSPTGYFSILALRFQSGAFTTAPGYALTGPPIIASANSPSGNIVMAGFTLSLVNNTTGSFPTTASVTGVLGGQFASYSPAEWQTPFAAQHFGPCSVLNVIYPWSGQPPYAADTYLDAGTIYASGPTFPQGYSLTKSPTVSGLYTFVPYLPPHPNFEVLTPGNTYTISSNGGAQVGPFSIAATLPTSFAVTNWNAITSINRANSLSIAWTGLGFNTVTVQLMGVQDDWSISAANSVIVSCSLPASAGELVIPADALTALPAFPFGQLTVTAATTSGSSTLTPVSTTAQTFVPSLVGGGQVSYGSFTPSLVVEKIVPIQ